MGISSVLKHDMAAWNVGRQFNINIRAKDKKTEKLASGHRINRAGDDAAGLSVSEKMRRQIRGLNVGTENAQTGISWLQIGEGALNEAHAILQRMNEITIKAQNGTATATDRAYMQAEFEQLQSELDRVSSTTTFNELNIFREHEPIYDQINGNRQWDYGKIHEVQEGKNTLVINFRDRADSWDFQSVEIEVAAGRYTTHELIDEIDSALSFQGAPMRLELNDKGFCSLNLENAEMIDTISGGLSYLLFDSYDGGGYGTLIGTKQFADAADTLKIEDGKNDAMEFWYESFDGTVSQKVTIDLLSGGVSKNFTKEGLMAAIDAKLEAAYPDLFADPDGNGAGLKTFHEGKAIGLGAEEGIITGFKGNMFSMGGVTPNAASSFYDYIKEGFVWHEPATVVGGAVLTTDSRDQEHSKYEIRAGENDTLTLQPNLTTAEVMITLDAGRYNADEMVAQLKKQFAARGLGGEVTAETIAPQNQSVGDATVAFQGVAIKTIKEGPEAQVRIDKANSKAYATLFTKRVYNRYTYTDTAFSGMDAKDDANASVKSASFANSDGTLQTVQIKEGINDKFKLTLTSTAQNGSEDFRQDYDIDIAAAAAPMDIDALVSAINTAIQNHADADLKRLCHNKWLTFANK